MSFSTSDVSHCRAVDIVINDVNFVVKLSDGSAVEIPYDWFPRRAPLYS